MFGYHGLKTGPGLSGTVNLLENKHLSCILVVLLDNAGFIPVLNKPAG